MAEPSDTATLDGLILEYLTCAGIGQELIDKLRLELQACEDRDRQRIKDGFTLWKIFQFVLQGTFSLNVVNVSGETLCQLQMSCCQTVAELKQRIHEEQQIPFVQQTLVHGMSKLRDGVRLADYKISPLSPEVTLLKCTSDKFYLAGGGGENGAEKLSCLFLFNGSDWSELAEMSRARAGFGMTVYDGRLYVFGGIQDGVLDDVEIYDPVQNKWQACDPMPRPCCYAGVAKIDGVIYVVGGSSDTQCQVALSDIDAFDPSRGTWTSVRPMLTARNCFGIAAVEGKMFCLGGYDGNDCLGSCETFNPLVDEWTTSPPMLTRRCMFNAIAQGNNIYAVGGWGGADGSIALAEIEVYSILNDTWSSFPPLLRPRGHFASVALAGKMYVIGGNGPLGTGTLAIEEMEVIDVERNDGSPPKSVNMPWIAVGSAAITLDGD